jgi:hypothetical protein
MLTVAILLIARYLSDYPAKFLNSKVHFSSIQKPTNSHCRLLLHQEAGTAREKWLVEGSFSLTPARLRLNVISNRLHMPQFISNRKFL